MGRGPRAAHSPKCLAKVAFQRPVANCRKLPSRYSVLVDFSWVNAYSRPHRAPPPRKLLVRQTESTTVQVGSPLYSAAPADRDTELNACVGPLDRGKSHRVGKTGTRRVSVPAELAVALATCQIALTEVRQVILKATDGWMPLVSLVP